MATEPAVSGPKCRFVGGATFSNDISATIPLIRLEVGVEGSSSGSADRSAGSCVRAPSGTTTSKLYTQRRVGSLRRPVRAPASQMDLTCSRRGSACERRGIYRLRRAIRKTTTRTTNSAVKTATKAPALIPIRPPCEFSQDDSIRDHRSNLQPRWGIPIRTRILYRHPPTRGDDPGWALAERIGLPLEVDAELAGP